MDVTIRRRDLLVAGGAMTAGPLAGCSYLQDDPLFTSIHIDNFHDQQLAVDVGALDPEAEDGDEPYLYLNSFQMDAMTDDGEVDRQLFEDAFESQKAHIQLDVKVQGGDNLVREFTYYPENHQCRQEAVEELGHLLRMRLNPDLGGYTISCPAED
ncbi:MAG: hypothetical protein ACOCQM_08345 [Natronomonas sp.]